MTHQKPSSASLSLVVLVASVRKPRVGRVIANWAATEARRRPGITVDLIDLAEVDLPLSDTRPGGADTSPIADRLAAADGFLVVTPEYNHSFPAALKNAIDWHHREWMFKPVGFVSYGAGSGGIRAVEQLRLVFAELYTATARNCVVIRAPWTLISSSGTLQVDDGLSRALTGTLDELTWWGCALRAARRDKPYAA